MRFVYIFLCYDCHFFETNFWTEFDLYSDMIEKLKGLEGNIQE